MALQKHRRSGKNPMTQVITRFRKRVFFLNPQHTAPSAGQTGQLWAVCGTPWRGRGSVQLGQELKGTPSRVSRAQAQTGAAPPASPPPPCSRGGAGWRLGELSLCVANPGSIAGPPGAPQRVGLTGGWRAQESGQDRGCGVGRGRSAALWPRGCVEPPPVLSRTGPCSGWGAPHPHVQSGVGLRTWPSGHTHQPQAPHVSGPAWVALSRSPAGTFPSQLWHLWLTPPLSGHPRHCSPAPRGAGPLSRDLQPGLARHQSWAH